MLDLMNHNSLVRCVAIAGHLHHGKTSFVQMLVDQTHEDLVNVHQQVASFKRLNNHNNKDKKRFLLT